MLIDQTVVTWDRDVFPCWQRSANAAARPNSDVWGPLPGDIRWFSATLEEQDIPVLYMIGSQDLRDTFRTYKVNEVGLDMTGIDPHSHRVRVRAIAVNIRQGLRLERPIIVADSDQGPFVVIDGNHRCLAYRTIGRLSGVGVYLGLARGLSHRYKWARLALAT